MEITRHSDVWYGRNWDCPPSFGLEVLEASLLFRRLEISASITQIGMIIAGKYRWERDQTTTGTSRYEQASQQQQQQQQRVFEDAAWWTRGDVVKRDHHDDVCTGCNHFGTRELEHWSAGESGSGTLQCKTTVCPEKETISSFYV